MSFFYSPKLQKYRKKNLPTVCHIIMLFRKFMCKEQNYLSACNMKKNKQQNALKSKQKPKK